MNGVVEGPEVDPPTLRFSRVAPGVRIHDTLALDVLVQVWSDGTFTCALRPVEGGIRVWGPPVDMEAPR